MNDVFRLMWVVLPDDDELTIYDGLSDEEALELALTVARDRLTDARQRLRLLLAYGRECQGSRPYRLAWLADAAGLSVSGVRTAYNESDVRVVLDILVGGAS